MNATQGGERRLPGISAALRADRMRAMIMSDSSDSRDSNEKRSEEDIPTLDADQLLLRAQELGKKIFDPANPYDITYINPEMHAVQLEGQAREIFGPPQHAPEGLRLEKRRIIDVPNEITIGGQVFHIEKKLGQGGQGAAFLAYPKAPQESTPNVATEKKESHPVVIKFSVGYVPGQPEASQSNSENANETQLYQTPQHDSRTHLYNEALSLSKPDRFRNGQPSLVGATELVTTEDARVYVMAMEYAEGGTLESWLNKQEQFPDYSTKTMLDFMYAARAWATELEEYMKSGRIHRDIKPSNLSFDKRHPWQSRVLDWGASKRKQIGGGLSDSVVGTPQFISPAKMSGKEEQADIYSLGVIVGLAIGSIDRPVLLAQEKTTRKQDITRKDATRKIEPTISMKDISAEDSLSGETVISDSSPEIAMQNAPKRQFRYISNKELMNSIVFGKYLSGPRLTAQSYNSVLSSGNYGPQFRKSPMRDLAFLVHEIVQPGKGTTEYDTTRFGDNYAEIITRLDQIIAKQELLNQAEATIQALENYKQERSGVMAKTNTAHSIESALQEGIEKENYDQIRDSLQEAYRYFTASPEQRIDGPDAEQQNVAAFSSAYAAVMTRLIMLRRVDEQGVTLPRVQALEQQLQEAHSLANGSDLSVAYGKLVDIQRQLESFELELTTDVLN